MDMIYCYLALAGVLLLALRIGVAIRRGRERRQRDFQRKLETVLLPRETVKAACSQKNGRWILTSRRLLHETKQGFTALEIKDIKSACGLTSEGKRTTVPAKMAQLVIKADTERILLHTGPEFEALAKALSAALKKRKNKKK